MVYVGFWKCDCKGGLFERCEMDDGWLGLRKPYLGICEEGGWSLIYW